MVYWNSCLTYILNEDFDTKSSNKFPNIIEIGQRSWKSIILTFRASLYV